MINLTKLAVLLLVLCVGIGNLSAYNTNISARRVENAPVIDGNLTDEIWQQARVFNGFKMVKPETGEPSEKTELRVLFDQKNLYIGVYCFAKDPSTIAVTNLNHDQRGYSSDTVRILLDPFQDKRNAYVFFVNPKGARTDGLATGEHFSTNWDGIWDAEAGMLPDGWTVEYRIPFKTLRFNWSEDMTWGFDVVRLSKQREDFSEWCYTDANQNNTLDPRNYGVIKKLESVEKPLMLQIIGSVVGSVDQVFS